MRRIHMAPAAVAAVLLAAGPAAAQGTFNPGGKPAPFKPATPERKPPSWPALPAEEAPAARKPGTSASEPAKPPGFKPYEPWKPASAFGPDGKPKK